MKKISDGIYIIEGSVNGGALVHGRHAVLIDMPETEHTNGVMDELRSADADIVDMVLLTQSRRNFCGGLFQMNGSASTAASQEEAEVLRKAGTYWRSDARRYHRYELFPDHLLPFENCSVEIVVSDGEVFEWNDFTVTCIKVGAQSAGEMIYLIKNIRTGESFAFCGSFAMDGGRIPELYSLQKALPGMMGYHGHMAGLIQWKIAAERLRMLHPDKLIPAYGPVINDPIPCLDLLEKRLTAYARNYAQTGGVRYYFAEEFRNGFEIPMGISEGPKWAETRRHPKWLSRIGETTSYIIRSENNHALLIDAGDKEAVDYIENLIKVEDVTLDAVWITHYHDDHLNAFDDLALRILNPNISVMTTDPVAQVIEDPDGFYLPAVCDISVKAGVKKDGEKWEWEGFTLAALHLPAQSLHHAGLLVEKGDERVLMCGDGFAPTGFDDYCPYNRNLPGEGRGYRLCLDLLKNNEGINIVNEHQTDPFAYNGEYLEFLEGNLDRRDEILEELLPAEAGLGLDPYWVRVYPAAQTVHCGDKVRFAVQVTGHGKHDVVVRFRKPWEYGIQTGSLQSERERSGGQQDAEAPSLTVSIKTEGLTSGSTRVSSENVPCDYQEIIEMPVPENTHGEYFIPADCFIDGHYFGSMTYAEIRVE